MVNGTRSFPRGMGNAALAQVLATFWGRSKASQGQACLNEEKEPVLKKPREKVLGVLEQNQKDQGVEGNERGKQ